MKSNRISKMARPCGIGEVVRPRAVTYSVTCQEWFVHGLSVSRILPTICVHMCRVMAVSFHSAKGDRKSTRLNSSHSQISYAVFCLKKKKMELARAVVAVLAHGFISILI